MPENTPVERMYQALKRQGKSKGSAAAIAQSQTGLALATGKPPKKKKKKPSTKEWIKKRNKEKNT
jgi:hypothetical protein